MKKIITAIIATLCMSLISSCTIEYDQTSYWVKCEMGYVGVEDNPITVSVTTPDGKKDYNVENGWYSEEFGPFTTGDEISIAAKKEGEGYFVYKIYVSEDGSNYEVKADRTCATTDTGSFLRIAL